MTTFLTHPENNALEKISGRVTKLKKRRDTASFVFTESDQTTMGVVAVGAALSGLSGVAATLSTHASSMEEEADYVEFDLDGRRLSGWLWRSPLNEGDSVDAAVERHGDHYELFGIVKKEERIIALYPHCSRGRSSHVKNAVKWMLIFEVISFIALSLISIDFDTGELWLWSMLASSSTVRWIFSVFFLAISLIAFWMIWKWMPFVRLAEKVFRVLELGQPAHIDLVKSSKKLAKEDDAPECGVMYFRY